MIPKRFLSIACAAILALSLLAVSGLTSAQATIGKPDEQTIADAYVYLLGRLLVIRQEHIDAKAPGFAWNTIKYNPLGSADFVNPNFDVAYLEAWFAVNDDAGVLLEVQEIKGRY